MPTLNLARASCSCLFCDADMRLRTRRPHFKRQKGRCWMRTSRVVSKTPLTG
jgi:hypothetical protein